MVIHHIIMVIIYQRIGFIEHQTQPIAFPIGSNQEFRFRFSNEPMGQPPSTARLRQA